jgi:hypothetical protein
VINELAYDPMTRVNRENKLACVTTALRRARGGGGVRCARMLDLPWRGVNDDARKDVAQATRAAFARDMEGE